MANILSRDAILGRRHRYEDVEVPEWDGVVRVWELSALRKLELRPAEGESPEASTARFVAACVGDESGPVDLPIENLTGPVFTRLVGAAMGLNVASVKAAEDLRKNLPGGPTGDSPTGSP
jgi:hypothetical protein